MCKRCDRKSTSITGKLDEPLKPFDMFIALARLIRLPNLVIVALTQYLLYYFVFHPQLVAAGTRSENGLTTFFDFVVVTLMLSAGGYVINDVMDLKADEVNKPEKLVISRYISRRTALWIYFCLQASWIFLSNLSGVFCKKPSPTCAIPYCGHWLI